MLINTIAGRMRLAKYAASIAALSLAAPALSAHAQEQVQTFHIPAQPLSQAIIAFSNQTGVVVTAPTDIVSGKTSTALDGAMSPAIALQRLLAGTDLSAKTSPQGGFVIAKKSDDKDLTVVIVTGSTSKNRKLITSSVDATLATSADLARKAPRSTADVLELVPGIFVEGTAGGVSNNYSVRGLQGGGQRFITLEEDGMPIVYGGGGADEFFSNDITIDHVEAVRGGSSGILTVNGAAATINFISKRPNFNEPEAMFRVTGSSYGDKRADFYYSQPLAKDLAFNVGGYIDSNPGVRKSAFNYDSYHLKAALEKRFDNGAWVRLSAKVGDQHDAYYADMPYKVGADGKPTSVPGLDAKYDNIAGVAFASIHVPDSCHTGACLREFSLTQGIHAKTSQVRLDAYVPVNDQLNLFGHARYLDLTWDFNGLFPGSGVGNAGLAKAVDYLTPGASSPIDGLLTAGMATWPTTAQFGLRDLQTGAVIPASDANTLNALNGNGLMQQTWLNHDHQSGHDFGSNFGFRYDTATSGYKNSLTVGVMYYDVARAHNQSAVAHVINDVRNGSHIYDVVALDANGGILGTLTDNGMVSYGDWGQGMSIDKTKSTSVYFNDELQIGDKLHVDFGLRNEDFKDNVYVGNTAAVNQPVPAGTTGLARTVGSTFDGTYTLYKGSENGTASSIGVNYLFTPHFSIYARYAKGFQTNGGDTSGAHRPTEVALYESGLRYEGHGVIGSVTAFRTDFNKQYYSFIDPINPTVSGSFLADMHTNGVEIDLNYKPVHNVTIDAFGVLQSPKLSNVSLNGVATPSFSGNTPERTPQTLFTITPAYTLPDDLGEIYVRYKYIGKIYADSGNGLALPAYGVVSAGFDYNISPRVNFNVSVDNITNVIGLTEGNPRQGATQSTSNGYFYGRGIVGRNLLASLTFKY